MKLQFKQIEPFVKKPSPEALAILVYGPDEGLIRERMQIMAKTVVSDLNDPFNVVEISADHLAETPSRLLDEAQSISMLGGRRVIRLRDATDKITATLKETLAALREGDNLILIEAGELNPRSTLRLLFEGAKNAAALPCYVEDERDISRILQDGLKAQGFSIPSDAITHMASSVVGDRAVARSEIEKLAIYMGGKKNITLEDVVACVGDSASLSIDALCQTTVSGQFAEAERVLKNIMMEGTQAVAALRALQNYFTRLRLTKSRVEKGDNIEIAMKKLKPEVFWKSKASFESHVYNWQMPQIEQAIVLLMSAEARCKQSGFDPETICSRAILSLAQMAIRQTPARRRG